MHVIALGLPFMFGFFIFISLMRGAGDTITPMLVMLVTVIVNIALDPVLIFGWDVPAVSLWGLPLVPAVAVPELGIQGAAVATIFSRMLAMTVGLGIMFSGTRGVQIRPRDMVPDLAYFRKMFDIGVPASIEGSSRALSINALLFVVGLFPTATVAAFGIGTRVFSVIFLPAIAVGQGVETMSGQNIGAGKPDRAERTSYAAAKVLFAVLGSLGVLIFLFPRPIVSVFTADPPVIEAGTTFLRIVALTFGFTGVMRAFTGAFRGAGNTMIAAGVAIVMLWVIRLPVAVVGALTAGEVGVWAAFAVSNVAGAAIAFAWFRRGTWREGDVRGRPGGPVAEEAGDDSEADVEGEPAATDD
jgi:putative MATE family efflux protein